MNLARKLDRVLTKFHCDILFEDDAIIVIEKSTGLLVIPDRYNHGAPCLSDFLTEEFGKIFVVHRLDRETSGVLVFAKTPEAHQLLNMEFESKTAGKTYAAIVKGVPQNDEGTIDLPLGPHRSVPGKYAVNRRDGKDSVTDYAIEERFAGFAFVEVRPRTGRTHQIRVHLSESGMPIVGDMLYGDKRPFLLSDVKRGYRLKGEEEKPLLSRTALHATTLVITHPVTNERTTFTSELPRDMNAVLKSLRKYAPLIGSAA